MHTVNKLRSSGLSTLHVLVSVNVYGHHFLVFQNYNICISCYSQIQDSFPFSIGLSSDEGPIYTLSNGVLFPKGHPFPSVKVLTLHRSNTFHLEVFYADQNELPSGVSPKISKFTVCMPFLYD